MKTTFNIQLINNYLPGGPSGILGGILTFGGSPGGGPGGSPAGLPGGGPGGNIRGIGPLIGLNIIGGAPGGGPVNVNIRVSGSRTQNIRSTISSNIANTLERIIIQVTTNFKELIT